jgi:23S rRNA (cytosine1962-C5)-methyltransferase
METQGPHPATSNLSERRRIILPVRYPLHWKQYELIDSGNGLKWEQFGERILQRPEPQALWSPSMSLTSLRTMTHWRFEPGGSRNGAWISQSRSSNGRSSAWDQSASDRWPIAYQSPALNLRFHLAMTAFKHVGLFPEQADNWEFIVRSLKAMPTGAKALNLFAYTGGASLAAAQAGAQVFHLDSVRQVVDWARRNADLSSLCGLHWVVEDARKFVQREIKRGHVYDAILLDPPAYGIGSSGERWKLEDQLSALLDEVRQLLNPQRHALLLNAYSLGLSPLILQAMLSPLYTDAELECGETALRDRQGRLLPLGIYARAVKGLTGIHDAMA